MGPSEFILDIVAKWEEYMLRFPNPSTPSPSFDLGSAPFYFFCGPRVFDTRNHALPPNDAREFISYVQCLYDVHRGHWALTPSQLLVFAAILLREFTLTLKLTVDEVFSIVWLVVSPLVSREEAKSWKSKVFHKFSELNLARKLSVPFICRQYLLDFLQRTPFYGSVRYSVEHESGYQLYLYVSTLGIRIVQETTVAPSCSLSSLHI